MRALHARATSMVRDAHDAGVPLYAGTDAGGGIAHGRIADEVAAMADAGLGPCPALAGASWAARAWLARDAGVRPGDDADFVVYPADPRVDVGVLRHPLLAVLRGRIVVDASR
jgi:imidazolonepropionase-like amidohydrolase